MLAEMLAGGAERQSRRPRPHADRGRAPDRRMGARDVRLPGRRQRAVRHRHLDGQSAGRACRARRRGSARCGASGVGDARRAAAGLRLGGGAWLRRPGDGSRGLRHGRAAAGADRRIASAWTWRCCARRSPRIAKPASKPFLVVGSAGTVDTGAIDDLAALADLCDEEELWFHVEAPMARSACCRPRSAPRLDGIERADSIAFDFHKWGQVPYDAGFLLVRDGEQHRATFASPAAYLRRETRGLAAGSPWPCDFGPDLSRGFRALKTWFTLEDLRHRGDRRDRSTQPARWRDISKRAIASRTASWNCWRRRAQHRLLPLSRADNPTGSMPRSSPTSRNAASPRLPPRSSAASSPSAPPSSITARRRATSTRWWMRC